MLIGCSIPASSLVLVSYCLVYSPLCSANYSYQQFEFGQLFLIIALKWPTPTTIRIYDCMLHTSDKAFFWSRHTSFAFLTLVKSKMARRAWFGRCSLEIRHCTIIWSMIFRRVLAPAVFSINHQDETYIRSYCCLKQCKSIGQQQHTAYCRCF